MLDPVGAFHRIRDNFILYVQTAFGTRFPSLEAEREQLLKTVGVFHQEPWIEPIPRYKTTLELGALTAADVPGLTDAARSAFVELARSGLFRNAATVNLYEHQQQMLRTVLAGTNAVVTSGTGSGKTESFLLPLLAYLASEAINWPRPGPTDPRRWDWWNDPARARRGQPKRVPQRSGETRRVAVRAMIVYPMNALVEDQMNRLRNAFDSAEARAWYVIVVDVDIPGTADVRGAVELAVASGLAGAIHKMATQGARCRLLVVLVRELRASENAFMQILQPQINAGRLVLVGDDGHYVPENEPRPKFDKGRFRNTEGSKEMAL